MKDVLADLLSSKKFLAACGGILAVVLVRVAGKAGIAIDDATAASITDRIMVIATGYLLAQGAADHGKEAAQIHADAQPGTPTPKSA